MPQSEKQCLICATPVPGDGPPLCKKHMDEESDDMHMRYADVDKPSSQPEAGLFFWQLLDREHGIDETCSTFKTNHTPKFCRVHWFAHSGEECPACRSADAREKKGKRKMAKNKDKTENGNGASEEDKKLPVRVLHHSLSLRVNLTEREVNERAQVAASKLALRDALDEERKAHNADMNGKIKTLESELRNLSRAVRDGFEFRDVPCEERFIFRTNTVETWRMDTNAKHSERAMLPDERQMPLIDEVKEKPKRAKKKKDEQEAAAPAE